MKTYLIDRAPWIFFLVEISSILEMETISETVGLISCVSEVSLCHAGSTRDSFLPGLPKTIGPNLAQMDTWETSRPRQLPIQTWTHRCGTTWSGRTGPEAAVLFSPCSCSFPVALRPCLLPCHVVRLTDTSSFEASNVATAAATQRDSTPNWQLNPGCRPRPGPLHSFYKQQLWRCSFPTIFFTVSKLMFCPTKIDGWPN